MDPECAGSLLGLKLGNLNGGADNKMNRLVKWLAGIAAVFCALFLGITQLVLPGLLEKARAERRKAASAAKKKA